MANVLLATAILDERSDIRGIEKRVSDAQNAIKAVPVQPPATTQSGGFVVKNKKRYKIRQGSRGGTYILVNGKKVYV
jgi:hypothetical protein